MWNHERPHSQNSPEEKKKSCRYYAPWLMTILQSHSNKTARDWQRNRDVDQENRTESPDVHPHAHVQLTCDEGAKSVQWREDSLFNKWRWESWTAETEEWNEIQVSHCTQRLARSGSEAWCKAWNHEVPRREHRLHALASVFAADIWIRLLSKGTKPK